MTLNSEEIKPVALSYACLKALVSQSVSHLKILLNKKFLKFYK